MQQSMCLKYEPSSELLHISAKQLFLQRRTARTRCGWRTTSTHNPAPLTKTLNPKLQTPNRSDGLHGRGAGGGQLRLPSTLTHTHTHTHTHKHALFPLSFSPSHTHNTQRRTARTRFGWRTTSTSAASTRGSCALRTTTGASCARCSDLICKHF